MCALRLRGRSVVLHGGGRCTVTCGRVNVRISNEDTDERGMRRAGHCACTSAGVRLSHDECNVNTPVRRPRPPQLPLQHDLAACLPEGRLFVISSPHGHDSFLIEIDTLNTALAAWMRGEAVGTRPQQQLDGLSKADVEAAAAGKQIAVASIA